MLKLCAFFPFILQIVVNTKLKTKGRMG